MNQFLVEWVVVWVKGANHLSGNIQVMFVVTVVKGIIGVSPELEIQNMMGKITSGDVFLLCSDGFYNKLNTGEIEDVMEELKNMDQEEIQKMMETLVMEVMNRGEKDNISSLVIKVEE